MVLQAMTPVCKREKTSVILFYCSCFFAFLASSNFFSLQGYLILLSSLLLIASECARGLPHNRFDLAILFLFGLCFFYRLPLSEIPLIFCVPRLLAFWPIAVLLLSGIANEEATTMMAADQYSVTASII